MHHSRRRGSSHRLRSCTSSSCCATANRVWNQENRFTGWTDVDLTEQGVDEARAAGRAAEGRRLRLRRRLHVGAQARDPDAVDRARRDGPDVDSGPAIVAAERAPLRCAAGPQQGRDRGEVRRRAGARSGAAATTRRRRRSSRRRPRIRPPIRATPRSTARAFPRTECLKDTVARVLPYWHDVDRARRSARARRVIIAAHGNSLRALVKYLDDISDDDIVELNIPTGHAARLRARRRAEADPPLLPRAIRRQIAAAMAAVAAQGRAR